MIREEFFPTSIYGFDFPMANHLNPQLEKDITEWSRQDQGLKKTNVNGWHSPTDMQTKPEYKPLIDQLFLAMNMIWKEEWLDREPVLGNMWANINQPGGYNRPHIHPNSLFSGVYYIKTPPNCGKLVCTDPRPGTHTVMPTRVKGTPPKHLWRECHLDAKEGRMIIFPAWLWHAVEPNESNGIRISVSFNFVQRGFE